MKNTFTLIFGFFLILLGMSFLLDIFHIFNIAEYLLKLWPLLLIIWGISNIIKGKFYWGVILIAFALLFLINNFGLVTFNVFVVFWPILIILLGLNVIFKAFRGEGKIGKTTTGSDFEVLEKGKSINEVTILSDKRVKINSTSTDGGSVVTVLGAIKLDLTETKTDKHGAVIEVVNVLGETTILVSDSMDVKFDSVPILGSIEDQRKFKSVKKIESTLLIKGVSVMGAIYIK